MQQLLEALLALPTVVYAALVAVSLGYWGLVIVGAADLNPFDGAEGAVKGGVEGAVKGGAEAVKALAADAGDAAGAVKGASALSDLLAFLGLRQVPVTISFTLFSLLGFTLSYFTRFLLDPHLPGVLSALAALGTSLFGGLMLTGAVTRPLAKLFEDKATAGGQALVGRAATVTIEVDERSGQVEIAADGVILSARSAPGVQAKRGDEVVILEMDDDGVALVEPLRVLVPRGQDAFERAARAEPQPQNIGADVVAVEQKKS
ncbi:MAG: hypothetical protein A2138_27855 [Deltaproteobacteria bacterium RBG_16_71_12]|nr:MAG: hypothetical protein A2138_27855 [Deltaproteobacteria bacterium RBG_16_71_12]